jgi:hypothetical protein
MLIGVMGAIVTLMVIAGMILMTPGNTESSPEEAAVPSSAAAHDDPDRPRAVALSDPQGQRVPA